jgi:two-component sensor histidine kinase
MPVVVAAFQSGHIGRESDAGQVNPDEATWLNVEAVPVREGSQVVAVLTHQTALADQRKASPLERAYLDCAGDLLHMLSEGTFPNVGDLAMSRSSPRVGDGFIRLSDDGGISFASPNAISAYHRMGLNAELEGHNLVTITRPLISDPFEAQELANHVRDSLAGGSSMRMEVDAGGAAVLLRTLPLVVRGKAAGAAMLIRDVTEVKRRDRALLSKDATIREIHHRVKNNLQTVAALLRLQARRTNNAEGRDALIESVRRVSSIALVHDALSMSVDEEVNLDEVVDRIVPIMNDVASVGRPVRINRVGDLGVLDADRATALVMVITELVQNAIEHAYDSNVGARQCHDPGRALISLARRRGARRRPRPSGGIQSGEIRQPWSADRADARRPPSWTVRWACTPCRPAAPTWSCGCRSAGGGDWPSDGRQGLHTRNTAPVRTGAVSRCVGRGLDARASLRPRVAPLECASLVLAHAAPDAGVLAGVQRPGQAFRRDRAAVADDLRVRDLGKCRTAVSHREEQFRILVTTDRLVPPIHSFNSFTCAQQDARTFLRLLTRAHEMFLHCCIRCFHRLNRCQ